MNPDYQHLQQQIADRERLSAVIIDARAERDSAQHEAGRLANELAVARNILEGMTGGRPERSGVFVNIGGRPGDDPAAQQARVSDLRAARERADARATSLAERLNTLSTAARKPMTATPAAVQAHATAIMDARDRVARFQTSLDEQDAKLSADAWADPRPDLERDRADLLAGIALDEVTADVLSAFDKAHAATIRTATTEAARRTAAAADISATRAGIVRKLNAARAELGRLEAMTKAVNEAFLHTEILAADLEYTAAAVTAAAARDRVTGLRLLLERHGGRPIAVPEVPAAASPDRAEQAERVRLEQLGVTLST